MSWNGSMRPQEARKSYLLQESDDLELEIKEVKNGSSPRKDRPTETLEYCDVWVQILSGAHQGKFIKERFFNTEPQGDKKGGKWRMVWLASKCGLTVPKEEKGKEQLRDGFTPNDLIGNVIIADAKRNKKDYLYITNFRTRQEFLDNKIAESSPKTTQNSSW